MFCHNNNKKPILLPLRPHSGDGRPDLAAIALVASQSAARLRECRHTTDKGQVTSAIEKRGAVRLPVRRGSRDLVAGLSEEGSIDWCK